VPGSVGAATHLRSWVALGVPVTTSLVLLACGGSGDGSGTDAYGESNAVTVAEAAVVVELKDIKFDPQGIKVRPGTTVTWVNMDTVVHNVRQVQSVFLSPDVMEEGDKFTFTFDEPGTYRYQCTYHHPNMNGVVIVEES